MIARADDQPVPLTPVADLAEAVEAQLHRTEDAVAHLRAVRARSHALAHWPDPADGPTTLNPVDPEC